MTRSPSTAKLSPRSILFAPAERLQLEVVPTVWSVFYLTGAFLLALSSACCTPSHLEHLRKTGFAGSDGVGGGSTDVAHCPSTLFRALKHPLITAQCTFKLLLSPARNGSDMR